MLPPTKGLYPFNKGISEVMEDNSGMESGREIAADPHAACLFE